MPTDTLWGLVPDNSATALPRMELCALPNARIASLLVVVVTPAGSTRYLRTIVPLRVESKISDGAAPVPIPQRMLGWLAAVVWVAFSAAPL